MTYLNQVKYNHKRHMYVQNNYIKLLEQNRNAIYNIGVLLGVLLSDKQKTECSVPYKLMLKDLNKMKQTDIDFNRHALKDSTAKVSSNA